MRPTNYLRALCFALCTSVWFNAFQGLTFVAFVVTESLYSAQLSEELRNTYWKLVFVFVGLMAGEYGCRLLAFGYEPHRRNRLIFETGVLVYGLGFCAYSQNLDEWGSLSRALRGLLILLLLVRYLPCMYICVT